MKLVTKSETVVTVVVEGGDDVEVVGRLGSREEGGKKGR